MIKSVFAATAALSMSAGAALAGPYVNVETNAGWVGDDYSAATTDLHVGYEGDLGAASYYVQAGPAIIAVDGEESETQFSGKAGASVVINEDLSVYAEVSGISDEDSSGDDIVNFGGKIGAKFVF